MVGHNEVLQKAKSVAHDLHEVFGIDLLSVTLYGSALTPEYLPKKSDLNLLVVLSEEGIERLGIALKVVTKWRRKKVGVPLFLTKAYIASSLDTFPVEFLNIKRNHKVIFGEDVLAGLSFRKEFLRIQCERELKGKLLLLRETYLITKGRQRNMRHLIASSVSTFVFIFNGLLYLLDKEVPATKDETIGLLARELNLDEELFSTLLRIRRGTLKPSGGDTEVIFRKYLHEVRKLSLLIDNIDIESVKKDEE